MIISKITTSSVTVLVLGASISRSGSAAPQFCRGQNTALGAAGRALFDGMASIIVLCDKRLSRLSRGECPLWRKKATNVACSKKAHILAMRSNFDLKRS